jgi:putative copper export protein
MRTLLLATLWTHLASSELLVGAFWMLLLAGLPREPATRRWAETVVRGGRWLVVVAIGSGLVWLLVRTAIFENRPLAALEPRAVWHAALDTWPGLVWLARHGLLLVLGAFLAIRVDIAERWTWMAGARAGQQSIGIPGLRICGPMMSASRRDVSRDLILRRALPRGPSPPEGRPCRSHR